LSSFNLFKDYGADFKNRKLKEPTKRKKRQGKKDSKVNTLTQPVKSSKQLN